MEVDAIRTANERQHVLLNGGERKGAMEAGGIRKRGTQRVGREGVDDLRGARCGLMHTHTHTISDK